jgi:hypothetical protein
MLTEEFKLPPPVRFTVATEAPAPVCEPRVKAVLTANVPPPTFRVALAVPV